MNVSAITRTLSRVGMKIYKRRAAIAYVGGTVLTGVGTYMYAKAAVKIKPTFDEHKEKMNYIREELNKNEMPEETAISLKKEKGEICKNTTREVVKTFAAPTAVYLGGQLLHGYSHVTLQTDLSRASTALGLATATLETIKSKIISEQGEEKWNELAYGVKHMEIVEQNENGSVEITKENDIVDTDDFGRYYLKFSPETSTNWQTNVDACLDFLDMITYGIGKTKLNTDGILKLHFMLEKYMGPEKWVEFCRENKDYVKATEYAGWVLSKGTEPTNDFIEVIPERYDKSAPMNYLIVFNCLPDIYQKI